MSISDLSKGIIDKITDSDLKNLIIKILNITESQSQEICELKVENQKLKDELNHLKGEQGKPDFSKVKKDNSPSFSSEAERKQGKTWNKEGKKENMIIDKELKYELSEAEIQKLPSDIRFLRYETCIQQNLKLVRENTRYMVAVYYSESQNKTYRTPLPSDYKGYFGSDLKTIIHVLTHLCDVTQSKLKQVLDTAGIEISTGSLNNILLEQAAMYESEREAILKSGLSGSYCGMDSTGSKQNGQRLYTQIINNELFSVFSSHPSKSRLSVLASLQNTLEPLLPMSYNTQAEELLDVFGLSQQDKAAIDKLFNIDKVYTKTEVEQIITAQLPALKAKENMFHRLLEALAIGYYQRQPIRAENLITDDAGEYKKIASANHGLCWVHDARYYKKLTPFINMHRQILEEFTKQYWEYYQALLEFKANPDNHKIKELEKEFDRIFTTETNYFQLNNRIEKTYANKDKLLAVLKHPSIPLHNNASELAARRVVTKRKINLHTISAIGTIARDSAMSVIETAKKLKVNIIDYINDRVSGNNKMPALADLILLNYS